MMMIMMIMMMIMTEAVGAHPSGGVSLAWSGASARGSPGNTKVG